jgi:hypothetical protein
MAAVAALAGSPGKPTLSPQVAYLAVVVEWKKNLP